MLLVGVCGLVGTSSGLFIWVGSLCARPWLRATTLLWGGVLMRLHPWPGRYFFSFCAQELFFLGWGTLGFYTTFWGVSQGVSIYGMASRVTMFFRKSLSPLTAPAAHHAMVRCIWGGTFISFFSGPYFAFFLVFGCFWVSCVFFCHPSGRVPGVRNKTNGFGCNNVLA